MQHAATRRPRREAAHCDDDARSGRPFQRDWPGVGRPLYGGVDVVRSQLVAVGAGRPEERIDNAPAAQLPDSAQRIVRPRVRRPRSDSRRDPDCRAPREPGGLRDSWALGRRFRPRRELHLYRNAR